jgi:hypothetical protein
MWERRRALAREWDRSQEAEEEAAAASQPEQAQEPPAPQRRQGANDAPAAATAGAPPGATPLVLARMENEMQEVLTASGRRAAPYVPIRGSARCV